MKKVLAIDIETQGDDGDPDITRDKILIISAVWDDGTEYLFDAKAVPQWFLRLLEDPDVLKLAHSAPFEIAFLKRDYDVAVWPVWDTLGCERLLVAGLLGVSSGLKAVCERRLNRTLNKGIRDRFKLGASAIGDAEREYCLEDSRVLHPIYQQQKEELLERGQANAARTENVMAPIVAEMELTGIEFDAELWEQYLPLMKAQRNKALLFVWDALGCDYSTSLFGDPAGGVSLTSHNAILPALRKVGIDLENYRMKTLLEHILSTDNEDEQALLGNILCFKKWDKAYYGWNYPQHVSDDGRIHAHFNAQGSRTFRFTSSKPNLQQVSRPLKDDPILHRFGALEDVNFRHLFRAQKGWILIGADYSQIEMRVLAELTQEKMYIDAFVNGEDTHQAAAELILKRALRNKDERNLGKIINFGVVAFGGGVKTIRSGAIGYGMRVTMEEAKRYLETFRESNPRIEKWGKESLRFMMQNGYLQTPGGHRRWLHGEERPTVAKNTPVQMFAGEILKDAMERLYWELRVQDIPARFVLQVHDEVVLETPIELAQQTQEIVHVSMRDAGNVWLKTVPTEVDGYISATWEK